MSAESVLKSYYLVIVVGGSLLLVVIALIIVVCHLYRQVDRLDYVIKLFRSGRENSAASVTAARAADLKKQQTRDKVEEYKSLYGINPFSRENKGLKYELETGEVDATNGESPRRGQKSFRAARPGNNNAFAFSDEEYDVEHQNQNIKKRLNPLASNNRRKTKSHRGGEAVPTLKPSASMRASKSPRAMKSDDQALSDLESGDEDTLEASVTVPEPPPDDPKPMEDTNASNVVIPEEVPQLSDAEPPPPEPQPLIRPKPLRAESQHYRLNPNSFKSDEDSVDEERILAPLEVNPNPRSVGEKKLSGLQYFQNFLAPDQKAAIASSLDGLNLKALQTEVRQLLTVNEDYRSRSKLPPRAVSDRVRLALTFEDSHSGLNNTQSPSGQSALPPQDTETSNALSVLRRYAQILAGENQKYAKRLAARGINAPSSPTSTIASKDTAG